MTTDTQPTTTVVNIQRGAAYTVYIGRTMPRRGLPWSPWGNPFRIGPDGTRDQVIAKYERYLRARPELMARIGELCGQVLGCWCKPEACHGDLLARLANDSTPIEQPAAA